MPRIDASGRALKILEANDCGLQFNLATELNISEKI